MFSKIFDKYISQKNLYFLILSVLVIVFFWKNPDILIMIFVSYIFACGLNPLVDRLENKMKRPLATSVVMAGFFVLVAIFIMPALYLAIYEISTFVKEFPQYVSNLDNILRNIPLLQSIGIENIHTDSMATAIAQSSTDIFKKILILATETGEVFLYVFTSIILLFFFLVDKDLVRSAILKVFPSEYRTRAEEMFKAVSAKLSGYVFAQTLVSGSVWVTMTIGLLVFKINYAILLGLIAGILSIIPIIGSAISLVICLIATYEMGIKYLIIVTILYTISHFIENHVVRPYVYSKFLNLHQAIIFLALVIGAKYQGVLGIILAPPFVMALYIILGEFYIKKMNE